CRAPARPRYGRNRRREGLLQRVRRREASPAAAGRSPAPNPPYYSPMGTTGKVLRGCLLAAGLLVLSMVAVVGLYIGWGLYANERAEKAANALCAGIRIGDPVDAVIAKAQA